MSIQLGDALALELNIDGTLTPAATFDDVPAITTSVPVLTNEINAQAQAQVNRWAYLSSQNGAGVVGFSQLGLGAELRTVADKVRESVSIEDFGAIGDGVTDDTMAFKNAVSASNCIILGDSSKTYLISSSIAISNKSIAIISKGASVKISDTYSHPLANNAVFLFSGEGKVYFSGVKFIGNRTALGVTNWTNYIHCISASGSDEILVKNCSFIDFPSIAVTASNVPSVCVYGNYFYNGMYHGVEAKNCNTVYVGRNNIAGPGDMGTNPIAGGIGVLATLCDLVMIENNRINNTSDTGTKAEGCNYVFYTGNFVTNSGKDGIKVQGYPSRQQCISAVVQGNQVFDLHAWRTDGSSLIMVADTEMATVVGNATKNSTKTTGDANGLRIASMYLSVMRSINATGNVFGNTVAGTANVVVSNSIAGASIVNVSMQGNHIYGKGAVIDKVLGISVFEGNIVDSMLEAPSSSAGTGVTSRSVARSSVSNNTIRNFNIGVMIDAQGDVPKSVDVISNKIVGTHNRAIDIANYGSLGAAALDSLSVKSNSIEDACTGDASNGVIRYRTANLTVAALSIVANNVKAALAPSYVLAFNGVAETIGTLIFDSNISGSIPNALPWGQATRVIGVSKSSAPTAGTWQLGDTVFNSSPTAGGTPGWVCTAAGSPGTWKAMANLAA